MTQVILNVSNKSILPELRKILERFQGRKNAIWHMGGLDEGIMNFVHPLISSR